jgi:cobalt-zinc-cadmium efflux system membrane fusion protein
MSSSRSAVQIVGVVVAMVSGVPAFAAPAPLRLTPTQIRSMGLVETPAAATREAPVASIACSVTPPLNGRAVAASPFAGKVIKIHVLEGQVVRAGQVLATIYSPDMVRIHGELLRATAQLGAANAAAQRTRLLASEGVVAVARAEEAEARAAEARALVSEQRKLIGNAGGTGGEFALRAPTGGRVAHVALQPGASVEAMGSAVTIDSTDRIWVEAQLPVDLVGRVHTGDPVDVSGFRGRVVAVATAVDARTRSAVLRAELDRDARLSVGQTATLNLLARVPDGAVSVPRSSVTRIGGRETVMVRRGTGYLPVTVTVIGSSSERVVVSGVSANTPVVITGVSQLKAAMGH